MTINYQQGKIYKIVNSKDFMVYVGSTSQKNLRSRWGKHMSNIREGSTSKVYNHMREVGVKNCKIVLLENWPCDSKQELHQREQYYMDKVSADLSLNTYRAVNNMTNRERAIESNNKRKEECKAYNRHYFAEKYGTDAAFRDSMLNYKKQFYQYKKSWGGTPTNWEACNMLSIDVTLFE